jgi:hypothetical protein
LCKYPKGHPSKIPQKQAFQKKQAFGKRQAFVGKDKTDKKKAVRLTRAPRGL